MFAEGHYSSIEDAGKALLAEDPAAVMKECIDQDKLNEEMARNPVSANIVSCFDKKRTEQYILSQPCYKKVGEGIVKFKSFVLPVFDKISSVDNNSVDDKKSTKAFNDSNAASPKKTEAKIEEIKQKIGLTPVKKDKSYKAEDKPWSTTAPLYRKVPDENTKKYSSKIEYMADINALIADDIIEIDQFKSYLILSTGKSENGIKKDMKKRGCGNDTSVFSLMWFIESLNPGISDQYIQVKKKKKGV